MLQKRDIVPTEDGAKGKEARKFKVLSFIFLNQFVMTDAQDPEKAIREKASSIGSFTVVATKESSFADHVDPTYGCIALRPGSGDFSVRPIRLNLDMGTLTVKGELSDYEKTIRPELVTGVGAQYFENSYLAPSLYSFDFASAPVALRFVETSIPTLTTGSNIAFWEVDHWNETPSPAIDQTAHYSIKKSADFAVRYQSPADSNYTVLKIQDSDGYQVKCYGAPSSEIKVPKIFLSILKNETDTSIEVEFMHTRLNTTHSKIDEIYTQSAVRHPFGVTRVAADMAFRAGIVEVAD